jgi:hypothetical protein
METKNINNPNLIEKGKLCQIDYVLGNNDLFEIYSPIKKNNNNENKNDKEQYIIYPNTNYYLIILDIKTQKVIRELKDYLLA